MATFKHFMLTRYALLIDRWPILGQEGAANPQARLTQDWFDRRLFLFARHTLSAITSQTVNDFTWLILYSSAYSKEVQAARQFTRRKGIGEWVVIDLNPGQLLTEALRLAISDRLTNETHVITSRVDNDDSVSQYFVELVQNQFAAQDFTFVNFTLGLRVEGERRSQWRREHNMFMSLIEARSNGIKTVLFCDHDAALVYGPIIELGIPGMWSHVIHKDNAWRPHVS